MSKKDKSTLTIHILELITLLWITIAFPVNPVYADVPSIENVEPWINGTTTVLNITVRHASPTGVHYIDKIEVNVNESIQTINLSPQETETFIVQYNLGEVTGIFPVSARAHCTFHGWGSWSEPIVVPEFSSFNLIIALVILPIILFLIKIKT
jgi:hypothetical protein